jgi:signal transduction histidine kinase
MYEKITLNLLSNAFKFTFNGKITLHLRSKKNKVELNVIDTGVGISAANQKRIFERFVRVENSKSRTIEGTGIGLALVNEMVIVHGGQVAVKSEIGKGTTFTVTIPKGKNHLNREKIFETNENLSGSAANSYIEESRTWQHERKGTEINKDSASDLNDSNNAIVLVADDNADMRTYLTSILSPIYNVIMVENGQKAIDLLKAGLVPDLVLTDVMMPEKDGYEVLFFINRDKKLSRVPVILLTAQGQEESKVDGFKYGAVDYIVKPFSSKELVARVDRRIQAARQQKQAERGLVETKNALEKAVEMRTQELQQRDESLEKSNHLLAGMNEELANLTFAASHDLREPIRKLSFFVMKLLAGLDQKQLDEKDLTYINRINTAIKLAGDLITDLSMYSFFNERPLELSHIALDQLISDVGKSLADRIKETNTSLIVDVEAGLLGDARQITQLLHNMISNSIKFRHKDRDPEISIRGKVVSGEVIQSVLADRSISYYELIIHDNGIGFAQEHEKQIFQIFRKLHVRSNYPGTGIGLTIVSKIVSNHNGFILTSSRRDVGATFAIYFPVVQTRKSADALPG